MKIKGNNIFYVLLSGMFFSISAGAVELNVKPGTLKRELAKLAEAETKLTLKGAINSSDFEALANLPKSIKTLDMSGMELKGGMTAAKGPDGRAVYEEGELPGYLFFKSGLNEVQLPSTLKIIGDGCFAASSLATVKMESKDTEIRSFAFYDCKDLSRLQLSSGVVIHDMAFAGCESLQTVNLPEDSRLKGKEIFKNSGIWNLAGNEAIEYSEYSLATMPYLGTVSLNPTTEAAKGLLMGNGVMRSVSGIPADVPDLFAAASPSFQINEERDGIVTIGDFAFAGNQSEMLYLSPDLSYIGDYAYSYCPNLKHIEANALGYNVPEAEETAFAGVNESKIALYVTADSFDLWNSHPYWSRFDIHPGESSVESIEGLSGITVKADKEKILLQAAGGIGNFRIAGIDGVVLLAGHTSSDSYEADIADYQGKLIVVKVWNNKGEKNMTIMR